MNTKILATLGLLLILASSYDLEGEVLVLNDQDDFNAVLKQNPYLLVELYAPWCGHCKKLTPIYLQTASALKQAESPIKLAKVDATKEKELAKLHGVRSYPTLVYYINGTKIPFKGSRTKEGIISWCNKKLLPHVITLDTQSYNKLKEDNKDVSVILYSNNINERKLFTGLALADEFNKYYIAPEELIKNDGEIELVRNFGKPVTYTGNFNKLAEWIETEGRPRLLPLDQRTITTIFTNNKRALVFVNPEESANKEIRTVVEELANKGSGDLIFAEVQKKDDNFVRLQDWIKVSFNRPRIIIFENGKKLKYVLSGELNKETILQFVQDFTSGNAKKYELGIQDQYTDVEEAAAKIQDEEL